MQKQVPYWPLSGFYFFYFGSLGIFLPYWSLYLKDKGFSAQDIGVLTALLVGTKVVAPNLLGWLADSLRMPLKVVRWSCLAAFLLFLGIFVKAGFWGVAWVTLAFSFFWNAVLPQFEAITLHHLHGAVSHYSRIRLWGSVGFILAVLVVSALTRFYGIDYLPAWIALVLSAIWINSLIVPEVVYQRPNSAEAQSIKWFPKKEVGALLLALMLMQIAHSPYYVFFSIHLQQHGYSESLIGWVWTLGVLAEIALFMGMHHLLHRYSLKSILIVSIGLAVLRWLLIGWAVDSIVWLVVAQLLHAATFGSSHVAAIQLIHGYFNSGLQNRGQALYSSISFGLGGMLGGLYSGFVWEKYGALVLYSSAAAISILAALIAWLWVNNSPRQSALA